MRHHWDLPQARLQLKASEMSETWLRQQAQYLRCREPRARLRQHLHLRRCLQAILLELRAPRNELWRPAATPRCCSGVETWLHRVQHLKTTRCSQLLGCCGAECCQHLAARKLRRCSRQIHQSLLVATLGLWEAGCQKLCLLVDLWQVMPLRPWRKPLRTQPLVASHYRRDLETVERFSQLPRRQGLTLPWQGSALEVRLLLPIQESCRHQMKHLHHLVASSRSRQCCHLDCLLLNWARVLRHKWLEVQWC